MGNSDRIAKIKSRAINAESHALITHSVVLTFSSKLVEVIDLVLQHEIRLKTFSETLKIFDLPL